MEAEARPCALRGGEEKAWPETPWEAQGGQGREGPPGAGTLGGNPPREIFPRRRRECCPEWAEDSRSEDNASPQVAWETRSDPGGGTGRMQAWATSPRLGAMGTGAPQSLLLLLLFLPMLLPRGASAGSLRSPGESWSDDWALVNTPSFASPPGTGVPSPRRGQSRWREQLSGPGDTRGH